MSNTTHSWPVLSRRRTIFDPIRPSPITPSCMRPSPSDERLQPGCDWSFGTLERAVAADQRIGGGVVIELRICRALELRDDALCQHLAQLNAPLVEGVDPPDRALDKDAVLVERHELAER